MNDKRDLGLGVSPMIEWCARYAGLWAEGEQTNWELYICNGSKKEERGGLEPPSDY